MIDFNTQIFWVNECESKWAPTLSKRGGGHPREVHKVGNWALDIGISGTGHWADIAQIITIQAPRKLGTGYGILGTGQGGCVQIITTQAAHDSPPTLHTLFSFTPQVQRTLDFEILLQIRIVLPPRFCMYCPGHRENRLFTRKALWLWWKLNYWFFVEDMTGR